MHIEVHERVLEHEPRDRGPDTAVLAARKEDEREMCEAVPALDVRPERGESEELGLRVRRSTGDGLNDAEHLRIALNRRLELGHEARPTWDNEVQGNERCERGVIVDSDDAVRVGGHPRAGSRGGPVSAQTDAAGKVKHYVRAQSGVDLWCLVL